MSYILTVRTLFLGGKMCFGLGARSLAFGIRDLHLATRPPPPPLFDHWVSPPASKWTAVRVLSFLHILTFFPILSKTVK